MATLKDTVIDGSLRVRENIFLSGRSSIKDAYKKITSKDNKLIFEDFNGKETSVELPINSAINDDLNIGDEGADSHTWSINRIVAALRGDVVLDHTHKISQIEGLREIIDSLEDKTFTDGKIEGNTLVFSNKKGDVLSSIELSGTTSSSIIRDDLENGTENVWSISKVVEKLSGKLGKDEATKFITSRVEEIAQPVIEEKLGELGTIQKGTEAPTNLNLFWLDTK